MELAFSSALRLLIDRDDVSHVMVGLRFRGRRWTDEKCISIGVKRKRPLTDLSPGEVIPSEIHGIKTDVIQSNPEPLAAYTTTYSVMAGGLSIGPEEVDEDGNGQSGTLGGVFWDDINGTYCGLTCWHVLAIGTLPDMFVPSLKVIHPSPPDGGRLDGYGRINLPQCRYVIDESGDAAVFPLSKPGALNQVTSNIVLSGYSTANVSDIVEKVGRTTGLTQGIITGFGYTAVDFTLMGAGIINMYVQAFSPLVDPDEQIVDSGDSGSILYRVSDNAGLGIVTSMSVGSPVIGYATLLGDQMTTLDFSVPASTIHRGSATASLSLGRRCYGQAAGSLSAAATDPAFSVKGFAIEDSYTSYDSLEEYAVAQGYVDEIAFLAAQGYATALEFAESEGYDSVDAFLAGQTIPSLQWILADCGAVIQ